MIRRYNLRRSDNYPFTGRMSWTCTGDGTIFVNTGFVVTSAAITWSSLALYNYNDEFSSSSSSSRDNSSSSSSRDSSSSSSEGESSSSSSIGESSSSSSSEEYSSSSSSLGESSSSSSYDYSSSSSSLYDNNILLWKMDDTLWDGSAGDVKDTTVYGYDGTSEGGAITVVDAEFDRAGYFDRDLVNEPLASLDITSNPISNLSVGTISLWVNPESTVVGNSFRSLVMFKFDSNNYYGFDIRHGGGDDLKFGVSMYIDSLSIPITKCLSTNVVTEGSWNHVVLVQDGLEIKLYLNGVEEIVNWTPNDTYKNVFLANLSPILMSVGGSSFGNAEVVGGNIANFEIYDEALTEEAIQRIYDRKA